MTIAIECEDEINLVEIIMRKDQYKRLLDVEGISIDHKIIFLLSLHSHKDLEDNQIILHKI